MGYIKSEFQLSKFGLEGENVSDFYLCCFQRDRSPIILLLIRLIVMLGSVGILLASMIMTIPSLGGMWFIFLTHWGVGFITVTSILAFVVSLSAYVNQGIDDTYGLPWYVKAYWVWFNLTVPIAFFITIFYWIFLTGVEEEFAINIVLDIFIHAINSVLMLVLLLTSRHTMRMLHFHHGLLMGILYLIFSVIYYLAGGLGPWGEGYIYPMLYWGNIGLAMITVVGSAVAIVLLHLVVVGIAVGRDALTKSYRSSTLDISMDNERVRYY